jgi:hypothetical protein
MLNFGLLKPEFTSVLCVVFIEGQMAFYRFAGVVALIGALGAFAISFARADVIGGRPNGCPHRYCGCASAKYVGLANKDGRLNLARNWLAFPRATPGPGMAVVRRGHVAIIVGGGPGNWQLYDPNSGSGLTRIHTRELFGVIVNPRG